MKIDESTVQAISSEEFKTLAFRVDQKMAQIIFRDKLYSAEGKIRVIVQEYMANARDAHRVAGKSDTPIDVTLPTVLEPEFIVRDYGNGIPPNVIEDIFVVYGASTKKNSNLENGGYGIGAKCAFSYVNAFSVTTTVAGVRYIYAASIDSDGMNQFTLLDSGPATGPDGTEVRVPIKTHDISQLRTWVQEVTHAWTPRPNITNGKLEYKSVETEMSGERWALYHQCSPFSYRMFFRGITVTVDDIPYTMTPDQSRAIGGSVQLLYALLSEKGKCLVLHFRVGEVTIPPQRESIDITPRTKTAITAAVDRFVSSMVEQADKDMAKATTMLEKVALAMNEAFHLQVARITPGSFKDEAASSGKAFPTESIGARVYEGRYSNSVFREFKEQATTSLRELAAPRSANKFIIDTKGRKMSPSDLKRLARNECDPGYGDVTLIAVHDVALFQKVVEVDIPTLVRVGKYKFAEREVTASSPRQRMTGQFFLKRFAVGFSEYGSGAHRISLKKSKVGAMPIRSVFIDMENGEPLFDGKPITLDRLCEIVLLYQFLSHGDLRPEYVCVWEDRFSGTYSPSDYTFLEDALVDAVENFLDKPAVEMTGWARNTDHRYRPSTAWPIQFKSTGLDVLLTKLGYNDLFCNYLRKVIEFEARGCNDDEDENATRSYVKKIWGLLPEEHRKAIDAALQASVQPLYDVRNEFLALAYRDRVTPLLLGLVVNGNRIRVRHNGEDQNLDVDQIVYESLKDHKPINPLFKATP